MLHASSKRDVITPQTPETEGVAGFTRGVERYGATGATLIDRLWVKWEILG